MKRKQTTKKNTVLRNIGFVVWYECKIFMLLTTVILCGMKVTFGFSVDGFTYSNPDSSGRVSVTGVDGSINYEHVNIPATVTYTYEEYDSVHDEYVTKTLVCAVTGIGDSAFGHCGQMITVAIPATIESIGNNAFLSCVNLQGVYISDIRAWCCIQAGEDDRPYADNIYLNGNLIRDLTIPDGTPQINEEAFYGYSCLTNVNIPQSVKQVGKNAFAACTNLTSMTIPQSMCGAVLHEDYSYSLYLFESCNPVGRVKTSIRTIRIQDGTTEIGWYAFTGIRESLQELFIPSSVTNVLPESFSSNSSNLRRIVARGTFPLGADELPKTAKYVVREQHLASWLPWLIQNNLNYAILDEATQEEVRVALGQGGVEAVGVMSVLGLSPARGTDASGAVATYAMPEISIEAFDSAVGRVEVRITPADGCKVIGVPVASCVAVRGSNNLSEWEIVPGMTLESSGYRTAGHEGRFFCTFDASAYHFYRVSVNGR